MAMTTVQAVGPIGGVERSSGRWWVLLISGIAWIIIGAIVLDFDIDSAATIGLLVGAFLIMAGITEFVMIAVTDGWHWLYGVLGALFLFAGISAFFDPLQTFTILARLFGFLLILKGTVDLVVALASRHIVDLWWMILISGLIELGLGIWASRYVGRAAALLILWVGIGALVRGVTQLVLAFQVRKLEPGRAV
jgi:uncharacterized membrane protein HdeD (DUF308 family)